MKFNLKTLLGFTLVQLVLSVILVVSTLGFLRDLHDDQLLNIGQWIIGLLIVVSVAWVYLLKNTRNKLELEKKANIEQLISQSSHVAMGEMIAMLTHQWKQPLTTMMMSVGTVKIKLKAMEMTDADEQFFNTKIEEIEAMVVDQNQLLTDFRDFFHADKEKTLFNIRANIDSVLNLLKGLIVKNSINIEINVPQGLEMLGYDRELRHVMINLTKNAIDQLIEKPVENPTIWIKAFVDKNEALNIILEDNGGGFDGSIIKTVFEPYASTKSS
jgi:nitrogen fixation/metabolism regulation signal transduction histidine kinase